MEEHVEWFHFTLCRDQSIGPIELRRIWMEASGTTNISVGRSHRAMLGTRAVVYSLRASPRLANLHAIEARLRFLLAGARLNSVLTLVTH